MSPSRRSRPTDARGRWITFEGIEGSGKSVQLARLAAALAAAGCGPVTTREPGGTALGRELRAVLLRPMETPMDPATELLLYVADRAQHLAEVVGPALDAGRVVLCDRSLDATLAYQGHGRGIEPEWILELHRRSPLDRRPDRTVLLDLDSADGLARARERNAGAGLDATEGRFEDEELDFHRRVRNGYLELAAAAPRRFRVVDAAGSREAVERRVRSVLLDLLPELAASEA